MQILITNDDGVTHPGLLALTREMRQLGEVTVLAPDRNWSASGHAKTLDRPMRVRETRLADGFPAWMSDGGPSDCVALAMLGLFKHPFDLVVSGINPNANVGHDVTYSGTVTAAMEAAISDVRGFAVSLDRPGELPISETDFGPAARAARRVVAAALAHELPKNAILSINVPYLPDDQIRGVRVTRMGTRIYNDALDSREDPRGRPYYWIGGASPTGLAEDGTDYGALVEGYVSVTPLELDLTDYALHRTLQEWNLA
ncbi:MAG TPA: 5'/3'-nucleotidase SurE [Anaerolineaceae bacterium]|nr:5'/3'-nucleotidase SurE [Anaerolineaceae bacterium]HPN51854.1 5'/3'-nucleotidase SurE [Anaerolineaceae bacterium]